MVHNRISSGSLYTIILTTIMPWAKELSETMVIFFESMFVSPALIPLGFPESKGSWKQYRLTEV
jgi:hypothetical protein